MHFYISSLNFITVCRLQLEAVFATALHSWKANLLWTFDWRMTAWGVLGSGAFLLVFTGRGCRNFLITDSCWFSGWDRRKSTPAPLPMVIISTLKNHPRMSFLKSCEGNIAQLLHSHLALELESSPAHMCMKIYGLSTVSVHTPTGQWDLVGYSLSCIITAPSRQTSCRPPPPLPSQYAPG